MIRKLILQLFPLNLEDIQIGSLITDPLHPHQDIHEGSTSLRLEIDCTASSSGPRFESIENLSNTVLALKAWNLVAGKVKWSTDESGRIAVDDSCAYELRNPTSRFRDLFSQEETKKWIEKKVKRGRKIYLITGIQTQLNTRVEESRDKSTRSISGSVSAEPQAAPVANALNVTAPNLNASLSHNRTTDEQRSLSVQGERVVAVRVRRIDVRDAGGEIEADIDEIKTCDWRIVGDQRAKTSVEQNIRAVLLDEDDDCGGTIALTSIDDGNEKVEYVMLMGRDEEGRR